MSETKGPLTAEAYAAIVRDSVDAVLKAAREAGEALTKEQLADEAGMGRTTLHRLEAGARTKVETVAALRATLLRRLPDLDIPPPIVPVESRDHYAWCQAGAFLMRQEPETFKEILADAVDIAKGVMVVSETKAKAYERLRKRRESRRPDKS